MLFFSFLPFITIEAPPSEAVVSEALGHSLCEDQRRESTLFGGVPRTIFCTGNRRLQNNRRVAGYRTKIIYDHLDDNLRSMSVLLEMLLVVV